MVAAGYVCRVFFAQSQAVALVALSSSDSKFALRGVSPSSVGVGVLIPGGFNIPVSKRVEGVSRAGPKLSSFKEFHS